MAEGSTQAAGTFILQERGLFWWADTPLPSTQFAPDSCIGGELRISREGEIDLDLDGILTPGMYPFALLEQSDSPSLKTKQIQGLLRQSNNRVLLLDLSRRGGRTASANVSYEGFRATYCLVGSRTFPKRAEISFRYMDIDLDGFEDWLRIRSIRVHRGKVALHATYHRPSEIDYELPDGKLSVRFDLSGSFYRDSWQRRLELIESAFLRLRPTARLNVEGAQNEFRNFEDLFVLLTDSEFNLPWPRLAVTRRQTYDLYFHRTVTTASPPRFHECVTDFIRVRDDFGKLVSSFKLKREEFGS